MTGPHTDRTITGVSPWFVVWLGFIALALAYSIRALLGLAMPVWDQAGLWSQGWSSIAGSVALLGMGISAPVLGVLLGRFGLRTICATGLLLLSATCVAIALNDNPWVFMLAFGIAGGIGFGILSTNVFATAVAWLFEERRGLATGICTAGATAGQFLVVPLAAAILAQFDWRWSFMALGIGCAMLAPFAWRLPGQAIQPVGASLLEKPTLGADLHFLVRSRTFHLLFWSFTICGYTTSGVIETHLLPYANYCGIPPVPSATAYGVLSVVNFLGMVAAGWMADRYNRVRLLAGIYFIRAIAFVVLMQIGASVEILLIFAVAFGAVDYSTVPITVSLAATHLGLRRLGIVVGLVSLGHQVGGALGALLGGLVFDLLGNYELVWQSSAALAVLAALMAAALGRDDRRAGPEPASAAA